jgi:hypothetical protein
MKNLFAVAIVFGLLTNWASGQVLVAGTEAAGISDINPTAGYELFLARETSPVLAGSFESYASLPNYASVSSVGGGNSGIGLTSLTVDGVTYGTGPAEGSAYPNSTTPSVLTTITLTGIVPAAFTLGIMTDNLYTSYGNTKLFVTSSTAQL